VGSIVAGVLGVILIAIIIFSVWVISRFSSSRREQEGKETEYVDADSAVILASISMTTLDDDEDNNEGNDDTQMVSIRLDDTSFYSANNVSLPIMDVGGVINSTANFDDSDATIRPFEISLSPM
jgi:hypothetical protein